ncbi:MAG TPA: hypothetical protein VFT72_15305 [Opitutaceae bacterium]|nr:hypothetical protein [Opitutaceae bacterium]
MNIRILLLSVLALAYSYAVWGGEPPEAKAGRPKANDKPTLQKGMLADDIIKQIGRPAEVKPMDAPEGKAEMWTYRRVVRQRVEQKATKVKMVPAFKGINGDGSANIGDTPDLDYQLEHITDYQMTALLIVDGKLVMARQWMEQTRQIDP